MNNDHLEDVLNRLANEPVPADVHKLAEKTSRDFSQTLNQSGQQVHILWEHFMKSRIAKLAIAAAIVIVAAIGLTQLLPSGIAWAEVVRPILNASTAVFDIVIGQEDSNTPVIHDEVMGSRIRRTLSNMPDVVSIIDLEQGKILALTISKKEAAYIDLKGLPSIPNYLEHLKNIITKLQDSPHFVVEKLDEQQIDGCAAVGFRAKHSHFEVTIWADAKTALPIRIEQQEPQMKVVCKNMKFDIPLDKLIFSMDVPEGFTRQQMDIDLMGATEQDFIEGLRIRAEMFGDGMFPSDVSVEAYLKDAPIMGQKIEQLKLTEQQQLDLGRKLAQHLLFIRFFKGDGPWHYAGKGVKLGDKDKTIFWYRPKGSQTYRVIYGDLRVEDVAAQDLPEPVAANEQAVQSLGYQQWSKSEFAAIQQDLWVIAASGEIEATSRITLRKGPEGAAALPITLPYSNAVLQSVTLADQPVAYTQKGKGQYELQLPLDSLLAGQTAIMCKWTLPLEGLKQADGSYQITLKSLTPVTLYTLKVALAPDSGLQFTKEPSKTWTVPFTGNSDKPNDSFGTCGLNIEPRK